MFGRISGFGSGVPRYGAMYQGSGVFAKLTIEMRLLYLLKYTSFINKSGKKGSTTTRYIESPSCMYTNVQHYSNPWESSTFWELCFKPWEPGYRPWSSAFPFGFHILGYSMNIVVSPIFTFNIGSLSKSQYIAK